MLGIFKKHSSLSLVGLFVTALLGFTLRLMFVWPYSWPNYAYLLHAHSHFAFAGWIFLALIVIVRKDYKGIMSDRTFSRIAWGTMFSAIGMLVSFTLEGYGPISISFSTLFLVITVYWLVTVWKDRALKTHFNLAAFVFIRYALFFLCLSGVCPLLLGPLSAAGMKGSPYYHDAIYFYIHFQTNGWMLMALLASLFNGATAKEFSSCVIFSARIFCLTTIPTVLIFALWHTSSTLILGTAVLATILNALSWVTILLAAWKLPRLNILAKAALVAISLKVLFQVLVCIPMVGQWVFSSRNLIIGYLHLLTLGAITPLIITQLLGNYQAKSKVIHYLNIIYLVVTIAYVGLLMLQPLLALVNIEIPSYQISLLIISALLICVSGGYLIKDIAVDRGL